jgi:uncharacterized protein
MTETAGTCKFIMSYILPLSSVLPGIVVLATSGLIGISPPVPKAGFECSRAKTQVEKTVCASSLLSMLDTRMNEYVSLIRVNLREEEDTKFRTLQREWLSKRNRCNGSEIESCIEKMYLTRLREIKKSPQLISSLVRSWSDSEAIISASLKCSPAIPEHEDGVVLHRLYAHVANRDAFTYDLIEKEFDASDSKIVPKIEKYRISASYRSLMEPMLEGEFVSFLCHKSEQCFQMKSSDGIERKTFMKIELCDGEAAKNLSDGVAHLIRSKRIGVD